MLEGARWPATGLWKQHPVVGLLGLTLLLAPALGVPSELMVQDTLKSMLVSFGVLLGALVFFWQCRDKTGPFNWHAVMWLPLALTGYALVSLLWSHTYLAGVEAIRWFVFSLLLWLGLNSVRRRHFLFLAGCIHWGAVIASVWVILQFLLDFKLFPQGPNPASTFVNRNFFAEFVVCTVPFSAWVLLSSRNADQIVLRSFLLALSLVALMMTGTRSALLALAFLMLFLPVALYRFQAALAYSDWTRRQRWLALCVLVATVCAIGSVPTGNLKLIREDHGQTAIERTYFRIQSISAREEFSTGSGSIRLTLWKATGRMILAHPFSGVGAGAWEVEVPLYQLPGAQLETDYYAHNEYLQLIAEYGLAGWLFILGLAVFLASTGLRLWTPAMAFATGAKVTKVDPHGADGPDLPATDLPHRVAALDAPFASFALASVLALLIVSLAGFPWRLASTGALFALALSMMAVATSVPSQADGQIARFKTVIRWGGSRAYGALVTTLLCLTLAAYISLQAATVEYKIVKATKLAMTVNALGDAGDPRWNSAKAEILALTHDAIAINPHYRKITPLVADDLARWGDWKNAIWIWQSVAQSRPHVVAVLTNIARGYLNLGDAASASHYLDLAKAVRPDAPSVRSLEVVLLAKQGNEDKALALIRTALGDGGYDYDLIDAAYRLGLRKRDWTLAIRAMTERSKSWPAQASDSWLKIGDIYREQLLDEPRALQAYRTAIDVTPALYKDRVRARVPETMREKL